MANQNNNSFLSKVLPSSTFGQTAMLIGGLLFINQLVSFLSVTHYFISPSYQQINQLLSNQINTLFLYDFDTITSSQKQHLTQKTGIRFHDQISAIHAGLNNASYYEFMSEEISLKLGRTAEVRIQTGLNYVIWIQPSNKKQIWISIPLQGVEEQTLSPLTMYFVVIGALSVIGGWLFVRRLNRPLQALQKAARKVGKGYFPEPLALDGSSEIKAVTTAFNTMSQGIKQLESDRIIMTAGISHDLRTPLTRIRLASEMLPDEHSWVKEGIEHDIDDLNAIINQFIDYARQDQQEEMEFIELNELVNEMVQARSLDTTRKIELKLNPLPKIKLRKIGIKRVIENLVENAFRYGSDKITISTRITKNNSSILCTIRDYGDGIEEQKLENLFTPFTQGDHARGSTGSGLGLAIVKRIVESHGGKINFSNHPDGGLNASFILPVHSSPSIPNKNN